MVLFQARALMTLMPTMMAIIKALEDIKVQVAMVVEVIMVAVHRETIDFIH